MKNRFLATAGLCLGLLSSGLAPSANAQSAPAQEPVAARQLRLVDKVTPADGGGAVAAKELTAYLLVYFKDETHSIYFATSPDGYTFTDVNNGEPIFLGADLAEQKGVRDPHIFRGPDNAFYLAMTDLHIFAKEAGLRDTQWERPQEAYGWGNNKNLILMKSFDLIHWTHARMPVGTLFPQMKDLGAVWAPETIYDPETKKLMVYFTTRERAGTDHLVYAYANSDFNTLETAPQPLFSYPDPTKATIDGDITKIGNRYHLFYVAHDKPGYLRQAVSKQINKGWVFNPQKVDPETVGTEAPNLWQRHGTKTYVLMYDVFGAKPKNNMGFSETTDFVHFKDLGRFNEPGSPMKTTNFANPKHGAVISISPAEAERLSAYFKATN